MPPDESPTDDEPTGLGNGLRALLRQLPVRHLAKRVDGWVNVVTGLGHALVDRVKSTLPGAFSSLADPTIADMFDGDAIVRKAIRQLPKDALRLGFRVHVPKEAGGHAVATAIQDAADDLKIVPNLKKSAYWERLWGGCALFVAADDGLYGFDSQEQPLRRETLKRILWLKPIDRTRIAPSYEAEDVDNDETSPTYGEPLIYLIDVRLSGVQVRVHRSRLILFPGMDCTDQTRRARGGWGISVLDYTLDALQRNATAWGSAGNAIGNAQYVVYKLKGLAAMFSAQDGEAKARRRAATMEASKSMINAVLIDADDEYMREKADFGNMPDMLTLMQYDTAAQFDMPATKLWGRSPAGQNATGESDDNNWVTECETYQEHDLRPKLHELIELLMLSKEGPTKGVVPEGWRVYFPPLRVLKETEKADVRLKTSQADASDIDKGILLPQEVALSRYRPEGYSTETQIDLETRERLLKLEVDMREKELKDGRGPGQTPDPAKQVPAGDDQPAPERQAAE
jgi:uncharacterized protein